MLTIFILKDQKETFRDNHTRFNTIA